MAVWVPLGLQAQQSAVLPEDGQYCIEAFQAKVSLQSVLITWQLTSLPTAHHWGILRLERSTNGQYWDRVACLPFNTTPRGYRPFRVVDPLKPGARYYRIVLERGAGELELAQVQFDNPGHERPLAAEPNFSRQIVTVNYQAIQDRTLLLRLYNHFGEQLTTQALPTPSAGTHSYELDFAPYPEGVYLVVITQVEDNVDIADHRVEWHLPG